MQQPPNGSFDQPQEVREGAKAWGARTETPKKDEGQVPPVSERMKKPDAGDDDRAGAIKPNDPFGCNKAESEPPDWSAGEPTRVAETEKEEPPAAGVEQVIEQAMRSIAERMSAVVQLT